MPKSFQADHFKKVAHTAKRELSKAAALSESKKKALLDEATRIFQEFFYLLLEAIVNQNEFYEGIDRNSYVFWTTNTDIPLFLMRLDYDVREIPFAVESISFNREDEEYRINESLGELGCKLEVSFPDFPFVSDEYLESILEAINACSADSNQYKSVLDDEFQGLIFSENWEQFLDELPVTEEQFQSIKDAPSDANIYEITWGEPYRTDRRNELKDYDYPDFWGNCFVDQITSASGRDLLIKLFDEIELAANNAKLFILFTVSSPIESSEFTESNDLESEAKWIIEIAGQELEIVISLENLYGFFRLLGYKVDISKKIANTVYVMKMSWGNKTK